MNSMPLWPITLFTIIDLCYLIIIILANMDMGLSQGTPLEPGTIGNTGNRVQDREPKAQKRFLQFLPPTFPAGAPYGYFGSAIFCKLLVGPDAPFYWNRACAGPVPPFRKPRTTTTTTTTTTTPAPEPYTTTTTTTTTPIPYQYVTYPSLKRGEHFPLQYLSSSNQFRVAKYPNWTWGTFRGHYGSEEDEYSYEISSEETQ